MTMALPTQLTRVGMDGILTHTATFYRDDEQSKLENTHFDFCNGWSCHLKLFYLLVILPLIWLFHIYITRYYRLKKL